LNPAVVDAYAQLAFNDENLGQYDKSLENLDKAIRLSPHDPSLHYWYAGKATAHFALKQHEQAIEWATANISSRPVGASWSATSLATVGAGCGSRRWARARTQSSAQKS